MKIFKTEKKIILIILLIISLSFLSAEAVKVSLNKEQFYQGQLLQAEINGNFIKELKPDNIAIYQGEQVHSTPTASSNLLKKGTKYYYYAVLPSSEGEYSLRIEDIEYYDGQETLKNPIEINFSIVSTKESYLSVDKGFIVATTDFFVNVKSFNAIQEITIDFKVTGEKIIKEISYNSEKKFSFSIEDTEGYQESSLKIGEYTLPVFIFGKDSKPTFINESINEIIEEKENNETLSKNTSDAKVILLEEATQEQIESCDDIEGKLCKEGEECVGPTTIIRNIICCTGTCEVEKKQSSKSWIGGIILLILLVGGLLWFYYKSRNKQNSEKTSRQILEKKSENYRKRMNQDFSNSEVKRSLTKT